jgi:hypothetical protein
MAWLISSPMNYITRSNTIFYIGCFIAAAEASESRIFSLSPTYPSIQAAGDYKRQTDQGFEEEAKCHKDEDAWDLNRINIELADETLAVEIHSGFISIYRVSRNFFT